MHTVCDQNVKCQYPNPMKHGKIKSSRIPTVTLYPSSPNSKSIFELPKKSCPSTSSLQLAIRSLDGLVTVLGLKTGDISTLPAERGEALGEDGVRKVVAGIHPVGFHGGQVLDLQLEQRSSKLIGVPKALSESIWE